MLPCTNSKCVFFTGIPLDVSSASSVKDDELHDASSDISPGEHHFIFELEQNIFVPIIKKDKRRKRVVLKPGWSTKLNHIIWLKSRLPCVWSFKRANFRQSNVIASAKCKVPNCGAEVIATSDLEAKTVDVHIKNYSDP